MPREIKLPPAKVDVSRSFDGKHVIEFNEGSHRYKLDGQACTGVTTFRVGVVADRTRAYKLDEGASSRTSS